MNIILLFFVAISLSMDAFSLSLAYGTIIIETKKIIILSIIVGLFHFFMPILGMLIGSYISKFINIGDSIIVFIIFTFIGINMIIESFNKKENNYKRNTFEMIIFGFAVSIDSFSIGIGLKNISENIIIGALIFSFTSFIFTYLGLKLGNKINKLIGKLSTIIGGMFLIFVGIIYIITLK